MLFSRAFRRSGAGRGGALRGRLSAICEHLSPAGRGSVQGAQVKVVQPVAGRLADGAQAVFLKGAFQPGIFQQFSENFGAALRKKH